MNFKSIRSTTCLAILCGISIPSFAQREGWHLKDKQENDYWGISLDQAYTFLKSTNRKPQQVIVGVIDSAINTAPVDLKNVLLVNRKDRSKNGKDEDKNGYTDGFLGLFSSYGNKEGQATLTNATFLE